METGPPLAASREAPAVRIALLAALAALVVVTTTVQVFSHDVWWHLATGEWILHHHALPRSDPFSSTSFGAPWVDHEWGFQVVLALLHRALGVPGLVLLRTAATVATVALLLVLLRRRGVSAAAAAGLTALAVGASRLRLQVRPELVSFALCVVVVALCTGPPRPLARPGLRLVGLALLFSVWANLHPAFLLGLGVLGAWATGGVADKMLAGRRPWVPAPGPTELSRRWPTLAACAAATCLNPWGVKVWLTPLEIGRALHRAGVVNPEWEPPSTTLQPMACILIALTVGVLLAAHRRLPVSTLLVALCLAAYASRFARGTGLFCLASPLLLADGIAALALDRPRLAAALRPPPRASVGVAGLIAIVATWLAVHPDPLRLGFDVDPRFAPVGAAEFLLRTRPSPELYNEIGDGGYLLWRLQPLYRVFLDGRNEVHAGILGAWTRAQDDPASWGAFLTRHRVGTAVVRHTFTPLYPLTGEPFPVTFARAFFPQHEWALVFWDDRNQVLLRRTPANAALIADLEYRCLHPEDLVNTAARMRHDPAFAACVRREISRRLREDPPSTLVQECARSLGYGTHP